MTAFQSCDWYLNLLALHKTERMKNLFRKPCYFVVSNEEKPVLIAPLEIHFYQLVEEQYETEEKFIRILDFTRGGEGYKKTIGCTDLPVSSFYFKYSRDTLLGQMR